jgi:hypothetical protein
MTFVDQIAEIVRNPAETTRVDFKELVNWASTRGKLELARDVVCLANRTGGYLIIGVSDDGGRFEPTGMADDDAMPDATQLGVTLQRYFDPPPEMEVRELRIDDKRFGVIAVREFSRLPHVCTTIGNDENNRPVLRAGAIYRRTDAMQCAQIDSAIGIQGLIESSVTKTGAALAALIPQPTGPDADEPIVAPEGESFRVLDLLPVASDAGPIDTFGLLDRLQNSVVRFRGGNVLIPRSIEPNGMAPSQIVREPGRVLIEKLRDAERYVYTTSVIDMRSNLEVRIREGLWEEDGRFDYTSLCAFALGGLLFAARFYGDTAVTRVRIRIGAIGVLGRQLVDDPRHFAGFHQTYVATTGQPLVARREVEVPTLGDPPARVAIARELVSELGGFFGFRVSDAAWDAHVAHCETSMPGVTTD